MSTRGQRVSAAAAMPVGDNICRSMGLISFRSICDKRTTHIHTYGLCGLRMSRDSDTPPPSRWRLTNFNKLSPRAGVWKFLGIYYCETFLGRPRLINPLDLLAVATTTSWWMLIKCMWEFAIMGKIKFQKTNLSSLTLSGHILSFQLSRFLLGQNRVFIPIG